MKVLYDTPMHMYTYPHWHYGKIHNTVTHSHVPIAAHAQTHRHAHKTDRYTHINTQAHTHKHAGTHTIVSDKITTS